MAGRAAVARVRTRATGTCAGIALMSALIEPAVTNIFDRMWGKATKMITTTWTQEVVVTSPPPADDGGPPPSGGPSTDEASTDEAALPFFDVEMKSETTVEDLEKASAKLMRQRVLGIHTELEDKQAHDDLIREARKSLKGDPNLDRLVDLMISVAQTSRFVDWNNSKIVVDMMVTWVSKVKNESADIICRTHKEARRFFSEGKQAQGMTVYVWLYRLLSNPKITIDNCKILQESMRRLVEVDNELSEYPAHILNHFWTRLQLDTQEQQQTCETHIKRVLESWDNYAPEELKGTGDELTRIIYYNDEHSYKPSPARIANLAQIGQKLSPIEKHELAKLYALQRYNNKPTINAQSIQHGTGVGSFDKDDVRYILKFGIDSADMKTRDTFKTVQWFTSTNVSAGPPPTKTTWLENASPGQTLEEDRMMITMFGGCEFGGPREMSRLRALARSRLRFLNDEA